MGKSGIGIVKLQISKRCLVLKNGDSIGIEFYKLIAVDQRLHPLHRHVKSILITCRYG